MFVTSYPPSKLPAASLWLFTSICCFTSKDPGFKVLVTRVPAANPVSEGPFEVKVQCGTFHEQLIFKTFPWFSIDSNLRWLSGKVIKKKQEGGWWIDASLRSLGCKFKSFNDESLLPFLVLAASDKETKQSLVFDLCFSSQSYWNIQISMPLSATFFVCYEILSVTARYRLLLEIVEEH